MIGVLRLPVLVLVGGARIVWSGAAVAAAVIVAAVLAANPYPGPGAGTPTPTATVTSTSTPTPTATAERSVNCAPDPADLLTNTVSSECGFPDTTNTGVPSGATLVRVPEDTTVPTLQTGSGWTWEPSGGYIKIESDDAVLKNVTMATSVDIRSVDNVTIQNVRIRFGGEGVGITTRHSSNVTIEDSEISGTNATSGRMLAGVKDAFSDTTNLQVLRNRIYWVSTGVQIDQGLIEGNYIGPMGYVSGDHLNGTTSNSGINLLTIRGNTSLVDFSQTDAISLFQDFSSGGRSQENRVITGNLVAGGAYCIYAGQNSGSGITAKNITVTNNHFSRIFYSTCGQFGPLTAAPSAGEFHASGNVWDDTGEDLDF